MRDLEQQLNQSTLQRQSSVLSEEEEFLGILQKTPPQDRNLGFIRAREKEKREAFEVRTPQQYEILICHYTRLRPICNTVLPQQRISLDYEVLFKEHEDVKKKLEASKARNKSLSSEVKTLKVQVSTLLEKGKHDDELVDALLVRR